MKTNQLVKKNAQSGVAIITVLGLVSLISIASGYIAYTASQEMHISRVLRESLKAKLIAESGLNAAYNQLKTDFSRANGLDLASDFGSGRYVVTSTPDPDSTRRYKLTSNGTCGQFGRYKVSADVENRQITGTHSDDEFALEYDFLGLGSITISGNFDAHVDAIHGNGNVTMGGGSSTAATTISSSGTVTINKKVTPAPTTANGVPIETLPAGLDAAIDELIAFARQNGEVYANGVGPAAAPNGGIAVCEGFPPANWTGGTGCYIFLGGGKIVMNNVTINNVNGYPSLVFKNTAEISFTGNVDLNGAVLLTSSSLRFTGNATVNGPLVVGQTVDGNGTANLTGGDQSFTRPPTVTDNVVISAWH
jgi:hypothetical protein